MSFYFNSASLIACTQHLMNNIRQYVQYLTGKNRCSHYVNAHCTILSQCVAGADSRAGVYFVPTVNCCVFFATTVHSSLWFRAVHIYYMDLHICGLMHTTLWTLAFMRWAVPCGAVRYHADVSPVHRIYDRNLYPNATQGVSILGAK